MGGRVKNEQSVSKQQERKYKNGGVVEKGCGGAVKGKSSHKKMKEDKK